MLKDKSLNFRKVQEFKALLIEIKNLGNFDGVLVSFRNGGIIAEDINLKTSENQFDKDEFAAMCASVLESAELISKTVGVSKIGNIIAELNDKIIVIIKGNNKIFFSFVVKNESNIEIILEKMDEIIRKLTKII
jgi:predicted regulator of Ras-like GTPase activity (Roadblock/LC7/MglB family)